MNMNSPKIIVAMLVALAIGVPGVSFAQSGQSDRAPAYQNYVAGPAAQVANPDQTGQTGRPIPQPKGGIATVIGVDQPENCLRIRSGPGSEYDIVGCAALGQQLNITGVWTSNDWAQLADNGWVYGPQIQTDLRPPATVYSQAETYVYVGEDYPVVSYLESYLPDYGYETYWYGGIPLFLYNVGVWHKYHPWWLRKHWNWNRHHNVWNRGPAFRQDLRAGTRGAVTPRNFVRNPSRFRSSGVTQFNANRVRPGSLNAIGSARTFSNPNTFRARTFSSPNIGTRSFSRPNISMRSFSGPSVRARSFSSPARMGSVGARSFSIGRMGRGGGGVGLGRGLNFSGGGIGRRR